MTKKSRRWSIDEELLEEYLGAADLQARRDR